MAYNNALTYSRIRKREGVKLSSPVSVLYWIPARWLYVFPVMGSSLLQDMTSSTLGAGGEGGGPDCCTIFLFVCTDLKSVSLKATLGRSVSLLSSEAVCMCGEVLTTLPLSLSLSLCMCVLRSVMCRNEPLNPYTAELGGCICNLIDPVISCVDIGDTSRFHEEVCLG